MQNCPEPSCTKDLNHLCFCSKNIEALLGDLYLLDF